MLFGASCSKKGGGRRERISNSGFCFPYTLFNASVRDVDTVPVPLGARVSHFSPPAVMLLPFSSNFAIVAPITEGWETGLS